MNELDLWAFVEQSNKIEGIFRAPLQKEFDISKWFLDLEKVAVVDLIAVISVFAIGHVLRDRKGLDVRVGNHIAPPGGAEIATALEEIVEVANEPSSSVYFTHLEYERLHPFTDGNGRSGRLLWLWMMNKRGQLDRALQLGFLHNFYYQTLGAND